MPVRKLRLNLERLTDLDSGELRLVTAGEAPHRTVGNTECGYNCVTSLPIWQCVVSYTCDIIQTGNA